VVVVAVAGAMVVVVVVVAAVVSGSGIQSQLDCTHVQTVNTDIMLIHEMRNSQL
jgi:hypothetical protein